MEDDEEGISEAFLYPITHPYLIDSAISDQMGEDTTNR